MLHGRIPEGPEEITIEWLTSALARGQSNPFGPIESFDWNYLRRGRLSRMVRISLIYAPNAPAASETLIAKFHPERGLLRRLVSPLSASECRFYDQIAPSGDLPTPICYYGDHDDEAEATILLLEDLRHMREGFSMTDCDPADAELVVDHVARFHAALWEKRTARRGGLKALDRSDHADLLERSSIGEQGESAMSDAENGARLDRRYEFVRKRLSKPPLTVVHDDLHVGNLFFGARGDDPTVAFVDFQLTCLGRGPLDVARFLGSSLPTGARRGVEMNLLRRYHRALSDRGVDSYTFDDCLYDYRLGLLWGRLRLETNSRVMAAVGIDPPLGADAEIARQLTRFATAVDDLECESLLAD